MENSGEVNSIMTIYRGLNDAHLIRRPRVIAPGTFDGVHLGHTEVLRQARRAADLNDSKVTVLTFDRHPAEVVRPESAPRLLMSLDHKIELLAAHGVDEVLIMPFDESFATMTADEFIDDILVDRLGVNTAVVGEDFHFGVHRSGTVATLQYAGKTNGRNAISVPLRQRVDGVHEPISSTAIRRALDGGHVEEATGLLGRDFEVRGVVEPGDQRGRTIGFPTANIPVPKSMCFPADAVYAGWYERPSGEVVPTAISIGRRPTFYEHANQSLLEAHLIDFAGDLYGEPARVRFVGLIRSQRRFDGIDALKAQLTIDVAEARLLLVGPDQH